MEVKRGGERGDIRKKAERRRKGYAVFMEGGWRKAEAGWMNTMMEERMEVRRWL